MGTCRPFKVVTKSLGNQRARSTPRIRLTGGDGRREPSDGDLDKPWIIGRLYRARLNSRPSFAELRRFCMIVERAHVPDLVELARLPEGERVDNVAAPFLHAFGLVSNMGEDYGTIDGIGAETWYEMNELGWKFLKLAFSI